MNEDENIKNCIICEKKFVLGKFNPRQKCCSQKCNRRNTYIRNKKQENNYAKKWYQEHRESEIEKNCEYRKLNKELFNWYHNKERFNGLRDIIISRDKNKCRACKMSDKISVHHKDNSGGSGKINNDIKNLIALCASCHTILHHWQRSENTILSQDEDIVRTLKRLRDNK